MEHIVSAFARMEAENMVNNDCIDSFEVAKSKIAYDIKVLMFILDESYDEVTCSIIARQVLEDVEYPQ